MDDVATLLVGHTDVLWLHSWTEQFVNWYGGWRLSKSQCVRQQSENS